MSFPSKPVLTVAITGAAGQIAYSLAPLIARGEMLGPQQKVILHLLDIPPMLKNLEGVQMELQDCAFPLLSSVIVTADAKVAFAGCDVVIMCGAFPRKPGMERKDLLLTNAKIFSAQGTALKEVAEKHCRVLVVGNPANTNALILATHSAPQIDPRNITALTRLDHNRALAQVAQRLNAPITSVRNAVIWGNHSGTQVPDVTSCAVGDRTVPELCADMSYFQKEFIATVQQRGAAVMNARGFSSACSAAKAISDHVHDWVLGTPEGTFVSMGVWSNGNSYGVPGGLIYSLPCTCRNGDWKVVDGLAVTPFIAGLMQKTSAELLEEKAQAGICQSGL